MNSKELSYPFLYLQENIVGHGFGRFCGQDMKILVVVLVLLLGVIAFGLSGSKQTNTPTAPATQGR